jgi:hypothetical protein
MKLMFRRCALLFLAASLAAVAVPQTGGRGGMGRGAAQPDDDITLPNGQKQKDEILKAEYQQNLKDASDLLELAQQLKLDLEKNDRYVVSMATIKKTDDIERLAKKIRGRLRR